MRSETAKRALDVIGATVALVATLPVSVAAAVAVGFALGRPVLFRQERPGRYGKPFVLLKFRTMTSRRSEDGQELPDRQRLTRLGRFLRASSIDELPELLNVLRGEMSLVGPRPLLMEYLPRYSEEQKRRHDVMPGITGWAQINGRNALSWDEKFALDCWYVDHWSNELDLLILARTASAVFLSSGISHAGNATMPNFMGNAPQTAGAVAGMPGNGEEH
jgi:sugar transferase EpsL